MGQTKHMIKHQSILRERKLREEEDSGVDVLTEELIKLAGMDRKAIPTFSGGTAGIRYKKTKKANSQ